MMKQYCAFAISVLALGACTSASTIPLSVDTIQITARAAPICGATGAERYAMKRAAVETLKKGYDKFIILNAQGQSHTSVVGYTPVQAHTTGSATATGYGNTVNAYGRSTTTYTGGTPITATRHNQGLVVKMFKNDDPAGVKALPARAQLGPEWQKIVSEGADYTCF
jgi:hypothetical protein